MSKMRRRRIYGAMTAAALGSPAAFPIGFLPPIVRGQIFSARKPG